MCCYIQKIFQPLPCLTGYPSFHLETLLLTPPDSPPLGSRFLCCPLDVVFLRVLSGSPYPLLPDWSHPLPLFQELDESQITAASSDLVPAWQGMPQTSPCPQQNSSSFPHIPAPPPGHLSRAVPPPTHWRSGVIPDSPPNSCEFSRLKFLDSPPILCPHWPLY